MSLPVNRSDADTAEENRRPEGNFCDEHAFGPIGMRTGNRTKQATRRAPPGRRRAQRGLGQPENHVRPAAPPAPAPAPAPAAQSREKRAGGPQDRALYGCACGVAFQAPVSASVRCPHCGDPQAW